MQYRYHFQEFLRRTISIKGNSSKGTGCINLATFMYYSVSKGLKANSKVQKELEISGTSHFEPGLHQNLGGFLAVLTQPYILWGTQKLPSISQSGMNELQGSI